MDHNRIYIEELIRKQLMEQLTADEAQQLEKEKARYTADEYDLMVVAMLDELKGQLPEGFLREWQPDYDAIRKAGDRIRRGKKKTKRWTMIRRSAAMLLLVLLLAGTAYIFLYRSTDGNMIRYEGDCTHTASNAEIPVSESACTIYLGDSTVIRVTADHVGQIRQVGNLLISRTKEGVLRLERRSNASRGPIVAMVDPVIATTVRQQCVVQLEDGTLIRLNAQSLIRYPIQKKDVLSLYFDGEALVEGRRAHGKGLLQLHTKHGWLSATKSDFVVRTEKDNLKAVLDLGTVQMYGLHRAKPILLHAHEHFGVVRQIAAAQGEPARDSLIFQEHLELASAKDWMKVIRSYKNMPMSAYVEEVSRWDGLKFEDLKCMPAQQTVDIAICYRSSRSEILASLRDAGVNIREDRGLLSFCPEENEKWVAMMEDD